MPTNYGVRPPRYRLPDATHVGRVRLQVASLDRSIEFYENVIGLRTLRRAAAVAMLGPQDDDRVLVELHERAGARSIEMHSRQGLYHFAILVPGRAALGAFVRHMADVPTRVASADHFVSEALYLWDPDGLGIEVYADRPRAEWKAVRGELVMGTEPLDVSGLAAAAAGPWRGLPRGTVIGHVHLHVGSLERSEALYHGGLGFDKTVWSYRGALFLSAGGYHHHLATNTWARNAPAPAEDDARLIEWEVVVPSADDAEAAAISIRAAGYDAAMEGHDRVVADDWGTRLRLTTRS